MNLSSLEKRERGNRQKEWAREDLMKTLKQDSLIRSNFTSDKRVDGLRLLREHKAKTEESIKEAEYKRRLNEKEELKRAAQLEVEAVEAYEKARSSQIREEKMRTCIFASSEEIRDLEKKLANAHMNHERSLQIQQKKIIHEHEKKREACLAEQMLKNLDSMQQRENEKEKIKHEKMRQYQVALANQLEETEGKKQQEYEQFLKEKNMVDDIVRKIIEEDATEAQSRMLKQQETKKFIEDYIKDREHWRQEELARQDAENRRIEAYANMMRERDEEMRSKKDCASNEKNIIYDKLAMEMEKQEREKRELEALRLELNQEEEEQRAKERDQEILRSRIKKRLDMIAAYQQQVQDKKITLQKEKEEEEKFRKMMMEKFANDEKLEQMNAQKRRMKQLQHKKAVDELLQERKKRIQYEEELEQELSKREAELENYKQQVIEQERQRLLREHAGRLLGYLPKGVFKSQQDLELFDQEFRQKFQPKA